MKYRRLKITSPSNCGATNVQFLKNTCVEYIICLIHDPYIGYTVTIHKDTVQYPTLRLIFFALSRLWSPLLRLFVLFDGLVSAVFAVLCSVPLSYEAAAAAAAAAAPRIFPAVSPASGERISDVLSLDD